MFKIISDFFSCPGPHHENQDAALPFFEFSGGIALAIADGIGGNPGGKSASNLAIATLKNLLTQSPTRPMARQFESIREALVIESKGQVNLSRMGTTFTVCIVRGNSVDVAHVGDTRVYHLRHDGIMDRTKDQTEVQQLIEKGILTKARAQRYHRRHVLLSALSVENDYELFENRFEISIGDRIILSTDGVYNLIPRQEIRNLSLQSKNPKELTRRIRTAVESLGPIDDYSAVCAEVTH